jgi:hypothetical protein
MRRATARWSRRSRRARRARARARARASDLCFCQWVLVNFENLTIYQWSGRPSTRLHNFSTLADPRDLL